MKLGVIWEPCTNAYYRAIDPMNAMIRRGHAVVGPADSQGEPDPAALAACDLVHVYRRYDDRTERVLRELGKRGVPFTYDNDDDFTAAPEESPQYESFGGAAGERIFATTVRGARAAHAFTTTTAVLAERYARAGVERVDVIPNQLNPNVERARRAHDGVVIGWIAAAEHQADAARVGFVDALRRLVDEHEHVRVESIGVDLGLRERYRYDAAVPFQQLPARIAGFDVGIAPLADIPMNRARSDIKLKEYAASGVPWLASPIGPYAGLGEAEGGRLVADDGWFEALDRLVRQERERELLGQRGRDWARGQTIDAVADRWERVFLRATGDRVT